MAPPQVNAGSPDTLALRSATGAARMQRLPDRSSAAISVTAGAQRIKIFESEDIQVLRRGAWSNTGPCVVTFDCYQLEPSKARAGFGEAFFEGRGVDAIHVLPRENDWYQNAQVEPALQAVAQALVGRSGRICTYGASMGGYAALRFARQLGAQAAIAMAPQFSIDRTVAPFDLRWKESEVLRFRRGRNGAFELPDRSFVIYDPSIREDAAHAALFSQQGAMEAAPILYAGHSVGLFLAQLSMLGEFVIEVLDGKADARELVRSARRARSGSAQYWASLARRASAGRLHWARQFAARATELAPGYAEYRSERDDYERLWRTAQQAKERIGPPTPVEGARPSVAERALGRLLRLRRHLG